MFQIHIIIGRIANQFTRTHENEINEGWKEPVQIPVDHGLRCAVVQVPHALNTRYFVRIFKYVNEIAYSQKMEQLSVAVNDDTELS